VDWRSCLGALHAVTSNHPRRRHSMPALLTQALLTQALLTQALLTQALLTQALLTQALLTQALLMLLRRVKPAANRCRRLSCRYI